MYKYSLA